MAYGTIAKNKIIGDRKISGFWLICVLLREIRWCIIQMLFKKMVHYTISFSFRFYRLKRSSPVNQDDQISYMFWCIQVVSSIVMICCLRISSLQSSIWFSCDQLVGKSDPRSICAGSPNLGRIHYSLEPTLIGWSLINTQVDPWMTKRTTFKRPYMQNVYSRDVQRGAGH